jgi:hypothetical protein
MANGNRVVSMVVGGSLALLFFFVPETFWDRAPRAKTKSKRPNLYRSVSDFAHHGFRGRHSERRTVEKETDLQSSDEVQSPKRRRDVHVGFVEDQLDEKPHDPGNKQGERPQVDNDSNTAATVEPGVAPANAGEDDQVATPSPAHLSAMDHYFASPQNPQSPPLSPGADIEAARQVSMSPVGRESEERVAPTKAASLYTHNLREGGPITYAQTLRPWNGRLKHDKWWRVMVRPFILFAYPAVLWSSLVYALSIGWLIVLSESVAHVYQGSEHYNFSPLATGLVYISPFIGGVIGTAVAGRVSDIIVRFMTRRNGGIYEPEFRLVMAIPVAISTAAGLMGFGWSAQEKDNWIVPTIFFGLISFGCSLGSTTSITFCVDSYRQYAGEALVTLNVSKSMFFAPFIHVQGSAN